MLGDLAAAEASVAMAAMPMAIKIASRMNGVRDVCGDEHRGVERRMRYDIGVFDLGRWIAGIFVGMFWYC